MHRQGAREALHNSNSKGREMIVSIYLHSSKDSLWEMAEKLGLEGDAVRMFRYLGTEEKLTYEVDPATGEGRLIGANGFKLSNEKLETTGDE